MDRLVQQVEFCCAIMKRPVESLIGHTEMLDALRIGAPINVPVMILVAHPDDETVAMGGRLPLIENLALIQLTDGSPSRLDDAQRAGHATHEAYAVSRDREAVSALQCLGVAPGHRTCYGARDQEAISQADNSVERLACDLLHAEVVITHPYEGGHPDHDTAACVVQLACDALESAGRPRPLRLEFASYHAHGGERRAGRFWPDPDRPEVVARLSDQARARKRLALDCYRSQSATVEWFDPDVERYRQAPLYDFSCPPPPGNSFYDSFGWGITNAQWRDKISPTWARFARRL